MPLDLTKVMTSIAVFVIYAMSFPWENSRRKEEVPITTSTPSTPVRGIRGGSKCSEEMTDRSLRRCGRRPCGSECG